MLGLLLIICLHLGFPSSVAVQSDDFPIGLDLVYDYTYTSSYSSTVEYEIQYEVLSWAPEVGSNIARIRVTTDGQVETVYVSTITWEKFLSNGTNTGEYFYYPLWLETSSWVEGNNINIPTLYRTFQLRLENRRVPAGEYPCWKAEWEDDSDIWTMHYQDLYYAQQSEVLIRYRHSYAAFGGGSGGSWRYIRELKASNLGDFSFYSNDFYNARAAFGLIIAVLVIALVVFILCHLRKRQRALQHPSPTSPHRSVTFSPEPATPPPEETVFPVEEPPPETSDSPPLEEGALSPCIVCRLPIKQGSAVLGCPRCGGFAHRRHLLEWVKVKGRCPYCHRKLKENKLVHLDLSS